MNTFVNEVEETETPEEAVAEGEETDETEE